VCGCVASRLCHEAKPGQILISARVLTKVENTVKIEPVGEFELRLLICRLYLGLLQTITDDYGAEFAAHSDSLAYRTIGIYVFLRTVMCSPVRASQIAGSGLPGRPSPLSGKCPGRQKIFC
jgi:hypothetical protein